MTANGPKNRDYGQQAGGGAAPVETLESRTLFAATPPIAAPVNVVVSTVSENRLAIGWTDASTNETQFVLERAAGSGKFVTVATLPANSTSFADAGLMPLTPYRYRVRASDGVVASKSARLGKATTATWLNATPTSSSSVTLSWNDYANGETQFIVERAGAKGGFKRVVTLGAGATSYSDTGLSANTAYRYRVHPNRSKPSLRMATASVVTTAQPAPQSLLVSEDFASGAAANFTAVD